jgi:hypothetical protein
VFVAKSVFCSEFVIRCQNRVVCSECYRVVCSELAFAAEVELFCRESAFAAESVLTAMKLRFAAEIELHVAN